MRRFVLTVALALAVLIPVTRTPAQTMQIMFRGYFSSESYQTRLQMMNEMVTYEGAEMDEFLADALAEVMAAGEARRDAVEATAKSELKRIIVGELGRRQISGSADLVYRMYVDEQDPLLKGLCLEALGLMKATEYAARVAAILDRLNRDPRPAPGSESIALGAIRGLRTMGEPVGYAPVFFASVGRYPARITREAEEALPVIVEDPTDAIAEIILENPDPVLRRHAVAAHAASAAPAEKKTRIAVLTLRESLEEATRNTVSSTAHQRLQTAALEVMISIEASDPEAVPLLAELASDSLDANVRVLAIMALGVSRSTESAERLAEQLRRLNDLQERGGYGVDNRIVRALIDALGVNGSSAGREELVRTKYVGYAGGITRMADEALARIR